MTKTQAILFAIILAIFLTVLVLWCAQALAHETFGTQEIDFGPPEQHRSRLHVHADEVPPDELDRVSRLAVGCDHVHYVIDYDDPDAVAISGEVKKIKSQALCYDFPLDTGEPKQPPPVDEPEPEPEPKPDPKPEPLLPSGGTTTPPAIINLPSPMAIEMSPEPDAPIDEIIEEMENEIVIVPTPERVYHEYTWYKGLNLVSFPVLKDNIKTLADLYNEYTLFNRPQDIIYIYLDDEGWYGYNGSQEIGAIPITPYLGVVMRHDWSAFLGMRGARLEGDGTIELSIGRNVVGWTELSGRYETPADFLEHDEIRYVVTLVLLNPPYGFPTWRLVGRAGDPGGDIPLTLGQAIFVYCTAEMVLELRDAPAAPQARRTITTTWGAIKAR